MALFSTTQISPGLQSGIDIINNIDSQKFPLVLNRIAQCIQSKSDDLKSFTEDEEEKLSATFAISRADLRLMLDCSTLILKQAAFNITKPAVLQQQLSEYLRLNSDKAEAFVTTWTSQAKNIVGSLKRQSVYPKQVEGVSWLLNTSISSSDAAGPVMEPRALIELKLQSSDSDKRNVVLDLDQSQLETLYETLETIQTRLDNLR